MPDFQPRPLRFRFLRDGEMHVLSLDDLRDALCIEYGPATTKAMPALPERDEGGAYAGQSTGLRDADGREVFEGDIIGYDEFRDVVVWDDSRARFITYCPEMGTWENHAQIPEGARVVGHVFEHPGLVPA